MMDSKGQGDTMPRETKLHKLLGARVIVMPEGEDLKSMKSLIKGMIQQQETRGRVEMRDLERLAKVFGE